MIVISGGLVLVALVLLALGLMLQDLAFVYGSIGVSVVSCVFLVVGFLQRRGEQPQTADGPPVVEDTPGTTGASPTVAVRVPAAASGAPGTGRPEWGRSTAPRQQATAGSDGEVAGSAGPEGAVVLVVPGRPRYHVAGCRYLAGRSPEPVDLAQARESYSACGVCRPDEALAAVPPGSTAAAGPDVVDSGVPGAEDLDADLGPEPITVAPRPRRTAAGAGGRGRSASPSATGSRRVTSPRSAASTSAPGSSTARPTARSTARSAAASPPADAASPEAGALETGVLQTNAIEAGSMEAVSLGAGSPSGAGAGAGTGRTGRSPARRGRVVVIPDRGRYHTGECRFVRDVLGTEELTRSSAERLGYRACAICRP